MTTKGLVALEYINKYGSEMSKWALAKKLYKERPDIYKSRDNARDIIRYHTGTLGVKSRKNKINDKHIVKLPNILLFDIETVPMEVYAWGLFKPILNYHNIKRDWCILSWAGKWLHLPEVFSDITTPDEIKERDDSRICKSLFDVLEEADIIISHNALKFDIRKTNSRFLLNGIKKPSPYQVIDTLKESRSLFAHSSHRLDFLGSMIKRKEKLYTNFDLWIMCMDGDEESLKYMDEYCKNDVLLLEDVYMEMRGWIKSHPNLGLYAETTEPVCPTCMSKDIESCGEYITTAGAFNSLRCNNCNAISRMRKSNLTLVEREKLRISVAR